MTKTLNMHIISNCTIQQYKYTTRYVLNIRVTFSPAPGSAKQKITQWPCHSLYIPAVVFLYTNVSTICTRTRPIGGSIWVFIGTVNMKNV